MFRLLNLLYYIILLILLYDLFKDLLSDDESISSSANTDENEVYTPGS